MGSLPDPSLLEYARFYGIAIDFTADDPLTHIETLQVSTPKLQPSSIERLEKAQQTITQAIHKEKLDVKIESARLLSTVIRDAKSEDINWAGVLPPFDRTEGFPVESPIFPAEYDTGIIAARKPLRYEETDIQLPPLEEPSSLIAALPTSLTHDMNKTMHDIKFEKLSCSKDAFMRIQRAKDCSGASRKDLEDVLMNELKSCQSEPFSCELPPLVLCSVDDTYFEDPSPISGLQLSCRNFSGLFSRCDSLHDKSSYRVVLEEDHDESLKCSSVQESDSSGKSSLSVDQNSKINSQTASDDSVDAETPQPSFIRYPLEIDSQPRAPAQCLFSADSPSGQKISDSNLDAAISSAGASITNDEICSTTVESPFSQQTSDKKMISSNIGHSSFPRAEPKISPAISPQPSCKLHEKQTSLEKVVLQSKSKVLSDFKSLLPQKRNRSRSQESPQLEHNQIHQEKFKTEGMAYSKASLSVQSSLGSLSSFMEVRGRVKCQQLVVATSQYFESQSNDDNLKVENHATTSDTGAKAIFVPATFLGQVPQLQRKIHQQSYLFVSTALLKTRLDLLQCIEKTQDAPTMIYRDYDATIGQFHPQYPSGHMPRQPETKKPLPHEADIIISPSTGVILTTSQAITQLHLPGHRPKDSRITDKCINSPLREQIFLLAPRYEHLYLLISHGTSSRKGSQGKTGLAWPVEKRTLAAFASLRAFCNSIRDCSSIVPLWVPSSPEVLARWILSLYTKHAVDFPPPINAATSQQTRFTPVNPNPQPQNTLTRAEHDGMEESSWEHFLRRAGLNPYAAQAVLAMIRHERLETGTGDVGNVGSLSKFIEMTSQRRRELFKGLIGEILVGRINRAIEKDWQCDWALNFNHPAEL